MVLLNLPILKTTFLVIVVRMECTFSRRPPLSSSNVIAAVSNLINAQLVHQMAVNVLVATKPHF